jgi:hypothetical protein
MQQTSLHIAETTIEHARRILREVLREDEYGRLKDTLELIERDRQIKNDFKRLRRQGLSAGDAIWRLSEAWHLSTDRIDELVYPRRRTLRRVS